MRIKNFAKSLIAGLMSASVLFSTFPIGVQAAQVNEYVDPADIWVSANGRTNELDFNATITQETGWCPVCNKDTIMLTYRTPEYTKSGTTALNRGVKYSDGTMVDGKTVGNLDNGRPNQDASYTTYHWTKSVCQTCGTINSVDGENDYAFSRNVYGLNSCDHNFFLDFDNTTYEPYSSTKHTTILKRGKYCQFCKGTQARATQSLENHHFTETIDGQLGNNRFYVSEHCEDCGYETSEYITAKSVVSSYYGTADENAHTVTVSDLSDSGVHTSIRYGTSAGKCNLTSAPNYTEAGYYPVYYEIDYKYDNKNMTENGVSYVWLLEEHKDGDVIIVVPPTNTEEKHTHDFRYLETVAPSCDNLGYERWQCDGCGSLEKRNYTPAIGHDYENITIREATCKQGGLSLSLCKNCGDFHQTTTPTGDHKYRAEKHNPTCRMTGYTEYICEVCGDSYMNNITPIISHAFEKITKKPTCTDKGYTTSTCTMCGLNYVSDYTEPTGHHWDEGHAVTSSTCESEGVTEFHCLNCDEKMIKSETATGHTPGTAATCTEPQTCEKCGTILELPTGHHYESEIVKPTCTAMGYTVYTCRDCSDSYTGNFTDKADHDYNTVVTAPTCTQHGFTTYACKNCDDEYISDYTDKIPHDYKAETTSPTCTEFGFTTYTCSVCGESYTADYTDKLPHNYNKQVIPPTCTEHGYTIYKCPDCGNEYIGDLTECEQHKYTETVIAPTCTEMGYTIFTCDSCGDSYKGNYTDKISHNYEATVTEPICTELGFTTYVCSFCGETHKSNYIEATGHKPSEWIIDTPATIESAGEKHIECNICGEILTRAAIEQLPDKDNSDEDGHSNVGNYSVLITDKNGKPVFDSEISIDKNDNIMIILPDGRLLSADDITTITVTHSETQQAVKDINIFIADTANNAATGKTDENGQLRVPNTQSSTGSSNGTVADKENTYVVVITDKNGALIPHCEVTVGENYSIDVKLPDGTAFNKDNRITATVVTEKGEAVSGLRVQLIGDGDFVENGYTNINGQITLPMSNTDITDENGKGEVGEIKDDKIYDYIVTVSDETGLVKDALITLVSDDNSVLVCLPNGKVIDYFNRTTVKVTKTDGTPVKDWKVTVYNKDGSGIRTEVTDEDGIVIVPPLSEAPISKPTPTPNPDDEEKPLPGVEPIPTPDNTDEPSGTDKPTGTDEPTETEKPSETQKPSEPTPIPDLGDGAVVQNKNYKYKVFVWDNDGVITEFGIVKLLDDGNLEIELPTSKMLTSANKVNIKVANEADEAPVKGITVTVSDVNGGIASDITNSNGIAVVPVSDTDITDMNGNAQIMDADGELYNINVATEVTGNIEGAIVKVADGKITVTLPAGTVIDYTDRTTVTVTDKDNAPIVDMPVNVKDNKGGDKTASTDVSGKVIVPSLSENYTDAEGKAVVDGYTVTVEDTKAKIEKAFVEIVDGKISIKLPDTSELTTSNQTTVTVTDKDAQPVKDMSVTVTDKNSKTATQTTNTSGKITVPVKTSSGGSSGGGSSSSSGGGGGGSVSTVNTINVKVTDKDGKTVSVSKTTDSKGVITVTLPTGKTLDKDNYYTITVTDVKGNAKSDTSVILKDKNKNEAAGTTDKNGTLILPGVQHSAYIVGYNDGTFRPESDMSRAEAAAIFARLISEAKGENISGKATFKDVSSKEWFTDYIGYLEKYDVIKGYNDGTFKPDAPVTRAEFVSMAVRYYGLFNEVKSVANTTKYSDVDGNYWAVKDISYAKSIGWLNGYADGTFKGDNNITRAEVVTVVNRATLRNADKEYINKNYTKLNRFTDVTDANAWYFGDVFEAANAHIGITHDNTETWVK